MQSNRERIAVWILSWIIHVYSCHSYELTHDHPKATDRNRDADVENGLEDRGVGGGDG